MLDVEIKTQPDWYPDDSPPDPRNTEWQELTVAIAHKLPDFIRYAYRDVCGVEIAPGQTIFDFTRYHGQASINQPDICIIVRASFNEKVNGYNVERLRDRINSAVKDFIVLDRRIVPGSAGYPRLDVVVRLAIEAGVAVGQDGKVLDEW